LNKRERYIVIACLLAGVIIGIVYFHTRYWIIRFARSLIGQQEISGNTGFRNKKLQELMVEVGWKTSQPWCVYFAKMVWYNMAGDKYRQAIQNTINGSSQQTWQNIVEDKSGLFHISIYPKVGDMVIWQNYEGGKATWTGHAGIVLSVNPENFTSIEGNTNSEGGVEGYEVAERKREYAFQVNNGLRLKGFISLA